MKRLRQFTTRTFAEGGQYNEEVHGDVIESVALQLDGTLTGASVTVRDDAIFRLLGTPEIVQGSQPLVRMAGADWKHIGALAAGCYDDYEEPTAATAAFAQCALPFGKIIPGCAIDGTSEKVYLRGTFGDFDDYAATPPTAYAATLRPTARAIEREFIAGGYRRPNWYQVSIPLEDSSDVQQVIRFEEDLLVAGLFLRTYDASDVGRDDGLIKAVRVDVNTPSTGGVRELARATWGQLRAETARRAGFDRDDYDRAVGTALFPLDDPRNDRAGDVFAFPRGSSLTLHFDCAATVEAMFSDTTPAAGDAVIVTVLGFVIVGPPQGLAPSAVVPNAGIRAPVAAGARVRRGRR